MQHLASRLTSVPSQTTGNAVITRFLDFDIAGTRYWWEIELVTISANFRTDAPAGDSTLNPIARLTMEIRHNERVMFPQVMEAPVYPPYQFTFQQSIDSGLVVLNRDIVRLKWVVEITPNANQFFYAFDLVQASLYGTLHDTRPGPRVY